MALLRLVALAIVAAGGCYGPELGDCVVSCASDVDCAPAQICGRDGRCATPALAGRCDERDGGGPPMPGDVPSLPPDAANVDASVPPVDAPGTVTLRIRIRGRGYVVVGGNLAMTCDHTAPGDQCMFAVTAGAPVELHAFPALGHRLERWKDACEGEQPTCSLTPSRPMTTVEAEFEKLGDDDD